MCVRVGVFDRYFEADEPGLESYHVTLRKRFVSLSLSFFTENVSRSVVSSDLQHRGL